VVICFGVKVRAELVTVVGNKVEAGDADAAASSCALPSVLKNVTSTSGKSAHFLPIAGFPDTPDSFNPFSSLQP
jgi:hypothetical protein